MRDAKWIVFKNQNNIERARVTIDGYMPGELKATRELLENEYRGDKIKITVE